MLEIITTGEEKEKMYKCEICQEENNKKKDKVYKNSGTLSKHLENTHFGWCIRKYMAEYFNNGIIPKCKCGCGNEVNWSFKKHDWCQYFEAHMKQPPPLPFAERSKLSKKIAKKRKAKYGDNIFSKTSLNAFGEFKETEKYDEWKENISDGLKNYWKSEKSVQRKEELKNRNKKMVKEGILGPFITEDDFYKRVKFIKEREFQILYDYKGFKEAGGTKKKAPFKCLKCNTEGETYFEYFTSFDWNPCKNCQKEKSSKEELEVFNFVKGLCPDAEQRNCEIVAPKELDIFIPSKNFAIEYNGLYWHSLYCKSDKDYHYKKSLICEMKDIKLFHLFSDDWNNKKDIIKSMIMNKLGLVKKENRIWANKSHFKEIDKNQAKMFFNTSHLDGHVPAKKYFGLIYNGEIVCAISFRKSLQKKHKNGIEICRFANKLSHSIVGGFSKLLKNAIENWIKLEGYEYIVSSCYTHLASDGNVYLKNGFEKIDSSETFWWTNGAIRENRLSYKSDPIRGKTEKEVAEEAGVKRIYGCRVLSFKKNLD